MSPLETFLLYALPRLGETLVSVVTDFFQRHPHIPRPASIEPWLAIDARHDAIVQARRRTEGT